MGFGIGIGVGSNYTPVVSTVDPGTNPSALSFDRWFNNLSIADFSLSGTPLSVPGQFDTWAGHDATPRNATDTGITSPVIDANGMIGGSKYVQFTASIANNFIVYAVGVRQSGGVWCPASRGVASTAGIWIDSSNQLNFVNNAGSGVTPVAFNPTGTFVFKIKRTNNVITAQATGVASTSVGTLSGATNLATINNRPGTEDSAATSRVKALAIKVATASSTPVLSVSDEAAVDQWFLANYGLSF